MRLFVAVWPPPEVVTWLRTLDRPEGVRWTTEDQWHVTLRFLGSVDDPASVVLPGGPACVATLGPATIRLGDGVLAVPVSGLDELAAACGAESYRGHLTLARSKGRIPSSLVGRPVPPLSWPVDRVALVRSTTLPTGAVYDEISSRVLEPNGCS